MTSLRPTAMVFSMTTYRCYTYRDILHRGHSCLTIRQSLPISRYVDHNVGDILLPHIVERCTSHYSESLCLIEDIRVLLYQIHGYSHDYRVSVPIIREFRRYVLHPSSYSNILDIGIYTCHGALHCRYIHLVIALHV